jgi:peptide/nickel transport system permease protein
MSVITSNAEELVDKDVRRVKIVRGLMFIIPVTILTLLVLSAIFAEFLAPYDPDKINMTHRLRPPIFFERGAKKGSTEHILGTDKLGRDILSRVIFGARVSLSISVIVILINSTIGTILGISAGYIGGRFEALIMRIVDISMAIPQILIAILFAASLGPSFSTVVIALTLLGWAGYARLIRGETLRLREADFVAQARIIGSSSFRIMVKHIFPNIINPLIILSTLQVGLIILLEAALSFLGAGIPAPTASWGSMVNDGRGLIDQAWWISAFPGIAIGLVVLSGNFFGDWLRDKLDPRLRRL